MLRFLVRSKPRFGQERRKFARFLQALTALSLSLARTALAKLSLVL
jgi:hypothetical protein